MQYNTQQGTKQPNAYQRSQANCAIKPWPKTSPTFTRHELATGDSSRLVRHLRQYVPSRSSRFHEVIKQDAGRMDRFLESVGFLRVGQYLNDMYWRPGAVAPDVFACSGSLIWSPSELPGTLMIIPVFVEGVGEVCLHVADVVSMTIAVKYGGDESAMLANHLEG